MFLLSSSVSEYYNEISGTFFYPGRMDGYRCRAGVTLKDSFNPDWAHEKPIRQVKTAGIGGCFALIFN